MFFYFIGKYEVKVLCYVLNEGNENVLFIEKIIVNSKDEKIIIILKDFGVKFVDILVWVCISIEKVGIVIIKFNVDSLLCYLKFLLCEINNIVEDR